MAFDSAAAGANGVIGAALCLAGVYGVAGVDADGLALSATGGAPISTTSRLS